jgi:hypothetical protein
MSLLCPYDRSLACYCAIVAVGMLSACSGDDGMLQGHPNAPTMPLPVGDTNYTPTMLAEDIDTVLQYHTGIYSNRPLGNSGNVALWTPDKVALLYQALVVTHTSGYTAIALPDLAHLVLAEAAAESTGNYNIGIGGSPSGGWGLLQVTPDTVVVDYNNHGLALRSASGALLLDPNTSHNLADPGTNTLIWGWYTKNAVAFGISADQAAAGQRGTVVADYGNALFAWLAGPGHDRHIEGDNADYNDYYQRNEDYFVQAGFGTAADFTALMDTLVGYTPAAWKG